VITEIFVKHTSGVRFLLQCTQDDAEIEKGDRGAKVYMAFIYL
jgi:hypothetical protein